MIVTPVKYFPFFLLAAVAAASVSITPDYVRMPVGSNQTFTVSMTGDGKLYDLKLYGPYLDWNSRSVWVGPYGSKAYVTFSPLSKGDYMITAELGDAREEIEVQVYQPEASDIHTRIQVYRSEFKDPEATAILDEAERLYNESRFELAEIKLMEMEELTQLPEGSDIPLFLIATVLAIVAVLTFRILL